MATPRVSSLQPCASLFCAKPMLLAIAGLFDHPTHCENQATVSTLELRFRQNPWLAGCSGAGRYLATRAETWLIRPIPKTGKQVLFRKRYGLTETAANFERSVGILFCYCLFLCQPKAKMSPLLHLLVVQQARSKH